MKIKNIRKRLDARVGGWEAIKSDGMITPKRKMNGKSCFTKPGSLKKR